MPRLGSALIRKARQEHPGLPLLLQTCRDLPSARLELRWLQQRIDNVCNAKSEDHGDQQLIELCKARARGVPLQYLLGTEYFGSLELACRPGVLVPRQETANSTLYLLQRLRQNACNLPQELRLLDLCTGTGCIPLLFCAEYHSLFSNPFNEERTLRAMGVDISLQALKLARYNKQQVPWQLKSTSGNIGTKLSSCSFVSKSTPLTKLDFVRADVLQQPIMDANCASLELRAVLQSTGQTRWDIITSNPPYISPEGYNRDTARSVRNFEPKLALVPPQYHNEIVDDPGDVFYPAILRQADLFRARIVLLEVANYSQALRVATLASKSWAKVEIWRDEPQLQSFQPPSDKAAFLTRGTGHGRSVFCYRDEGIDWVNDPEIVASDAEPVS